MIRSLSRLVASTLLTLCLCAAFACESHARAGTVFVNGVPVLQLKTGIGDVAANDRATSLAKALRYATEDDEVSVKKAGAEFVIVIGTNPMLKVGEGEAASHNTTTEKLANGWANAIRDALNLPTLKFPDDFMRLPLGTVKNIALVGSESLNAAVTTTNDGVVKIKRIDGGVQLTCVGNGDADILAEGGNSLRKLSISVRPYAALLPQTLSVEVVGNPTNGSTVKSAIEGAIKTQLVHVQGASVSFGPVEGSSLGSGAGKSFTVRTRVRAEDCFDAAGDVSISVKNVAGGKPATTLWYSNSPENVKQIGCVFAQFLKPNQPVRFLYHHIDGSTQPLIIRAEAVNDSDKPARIRISAADSKPDENPVRAGLNVANQFFKYHLTGSGEIVTIPPHCTLPFCFRRLSPRETASGLCTLCLLGGPAQLQVRTDALPPYDLNGPWTDATYSSTPWREVGTNPINDLDRASYEPSEHIYPDPYKSETMNYEVGGRAGYLVLGRKPIAGQDHNDNLDGNYGVLYTVKTKVSNPTSGPADVELIFESSAGYTSGLFVVDGLFVQVPFLGPKQTSRITSFHLAPGASRTVEILTMPIAGGAYPATLTLRAVESSH